MSGGQRRPELHVEALLKDEDDSCERYEPKAVIESAVVGWLRSEFATLIVGQSIQIQASKCSFAPTVMSIYVDDFIGPKQSSHEKDLEGLVVKVHAYALHSPHALLPGRLHRHSNQDGVTEKLIQLPSSSLAGTWNSLKFDGICPRQILRSVVRIVVLMQQPGLKLDDLNLNRLVLFHGPPGCGKTTLSRALAQKLTIRLGTYFDEGSLFEINSQSLLSKYFSESGNLVTQMFERIISLAQDKSRLVCVLIDEVESIAASREQLTQSGECHDTIRVTNQLLTALDRIRDYSNIVVLCTSNMKDSIDTAFLDRVDYEVSIPTPCESAIYEILRTTINELIRCGVITSPPCTVSTTVPPSLDDDDVYIPDYATLVALHDKPDCPARAVARLAGQCSGGSGRKLRKLPLLAITTYTWGESCPLGDALEALEKAVDAFIGPGRDVEMS